ncbi:TPA: hypothetical protein DIV55_01185 [Patescibacteria group bacterium]|nr:hypothetical protein [Patescibacteria group bacterium]
MKIGAHVSIAKGIPAALIKIQTMGANCLQIFSSSPRSFGTPKATDDDCSKFKTEAKRRGIGPNFIHANYLVNLGTDKQRLLELSTQSLVTDLNFADKVGARGVIVHTGSHGGRGFDKVLNPVANVIKKILKTANGEAKLLLEITSGGKGRIGANFQELQQLLQAVNHPRLGVCLDTCHMFAAGYAFDSAEKITELKKQIQATVGWSNIYCLHVNDSKGEFASHIDRHENIGKGKIGKAPFKLLLHDEKFKELPFILETPGFDDKGPDKQNIDILKSLL